MPARAQKRRVLYCRVRLSSSTRRTTRSGRRGSALIARQPGANSISRRWEGAGASDAEAHLDGGALVGQVVELSFASDVRHVPEIANGRHAPLFEVEQDEVRRLC